jgi:hypothetical protein
MKLIGAVAIALTLAVSTHAQSLADAAKKAQEERAKTGQGDAKSEGKKVTDSSAKKVYTNKDLADLPAVVTPPSEGQTESAAKESASTRKVDKTDKVEKTDKPIEPVKDEAYWRARVAPPNKKIHDNIVKSLAMKRRIDELTTELLGIGALNARRGGVETERQRLISESDDLDRTLQADIQAVKDVEEEGRRAGALPGWFR